MQELSRRQALKLLAGLGSLSLMPALRAAAAAAFPASLTRFNEGLNARVAAQLGRDYLEQRPDDADRERLLGSLLEDSGDPADLTEILSHRVRADFAAGRVVDLNDWQVSVTEARIFAAIALTP